MSTAISSESGARARLSRPPEPRIVDCYSHAWHAMLAHLPLLLVLGLIVTAVAAAGEAFVVDKTTEVYPGLWVSGMSVCTTLGGPRMGPIFGGMLLSGKRVAELILADLK